MMRDVRCEIVGRVRVSRSPENEKWDRILIFEFVFPYFHFFIFFSLVFFLVSFVGFFLVFVFV